MQHQSVHLVKSSPSSPKYFCVHCDPSPSCYWYSYDAIEKVHAHWLSNHTDLPEALPFQFYAVESVVCAHCPDRCGLFKFIKTHHKKTHEDEGLPFIAVRKQMREQCAMCHYRGIDLFSHFQESHTTFASSDQIVFNPICFTTEFLNEMLQTNCHRLFQCGHCGATFQSEHETKWHCSEKHANLKDWQVIQQNCAPNRILYVICSVCHCKIQSSDLLNHMLEESQAFAHTFDQFYANYLKVKVVFANGLTVFMQNLTCSPYDHTKQILQLFQHGQK